MHNFINIIVFYKYIFFNTKSNFKVWLVFIVHFNIRDSFNYFQSLWSKNTFFNFRRDSRSPDEKSRSPSREKNGDASPQSGDDQMIRDTFLNPL